MDLSCKLINIDCSWPNFGLDCSKSLAYTLSCFELWTKIRHWAHCTLLIRRRRVKTRVVIFILEEGFKMNGHVRNKVALVTYFSFGTCRQLSYFLSSPPVQSHMPVKRLERLACLNNASLTTIVLKRTRDFQDTLCNPYMDSNNKKSQSEN